MFGQRGFRYLFLAVLVNRLGGFVVPFLAIYLTQVRGLGTATTGAIAALYGVGAIFSQLIGGYLADRFGRRRAIVFGFIASAASITLLSAARDLAALELATLFVGLSEGLSRPGIQAALADLVGPEQRQRAYTYIYWAANLGFAVASVLAGLLAETRFETLFIADAATSLAAGLVIYLRLPETRPSSEARSRSLSSVLAPARSARFRALFVIALIATLVFVQFSSTMPIDLRSRGVDGRTYGALAGLNGLLVVLLQPLSLRFAARVRPYDALAVGALLSGLGFGLFGVTSTPLGFALAIVVITLGEIATAPAGGTVVAEIAPAHLRGTFQGAYGMTWSAAGALGPLIGSRALDTLGSRTFWFAAFAVSAIAAGAYFARSQREARKSAPESVPERA